MKLAAIFQDHMIFQAGKPIRIFGSADEKVTVTFLEQTVSVQPGKGQFLLQLEAEDDYGGPYDMTVTSGSETVVLHDLMIGEVLLCAGQSNMQFMLSEEVTPPDEYLSDPLLRLFSVDRPEMNEAFASADGWISCEESSVGRWSALAYLIGIRMREDADCPVGIVLCAQGASVIQSWMDSQALDDPAFRIPDDQLFIDHRHPLYQRWNSPSQLYHDMLETILPYSFGNVIWYQGESNASPAEGKVYGKMLKRMIENWRRSDMDDYLPFVVIQIADTRTDEGWLGVQNAQFMIPLYVPQTTCVRCGDICEKDQIHPVTKGPLAERIIPVLTWAD